MHVSAARCLGDLRGAGARSWGPHPCGVVRAGRRWQPFGACSGVGLLFFCFSIEHHGSGGLSSRKILPLVMPLQSLDTDKIVELKGWSIVVSQKGLCFLTMSCLACCVFSPKLWMSQVKFVLREAGRPKPSEIRFSEHADAFALYGPQPSSTPPSPPEIA